LVNHSNLAVAGQEKAFDPLVVDMAHMQNAATVNSDTGEVESLVAGSMLVDTVVDMLREREGMR
jgi:hypothetical protein